MEKQYYGGAYDIYTNLYAGIYKGRACWENVPEYPIRLQLSPWHGSEESTNVIVKPWEMCP